MAYLTEVANKLEQELEAERNGMRDIFGAPQGGEDGGLLGQLPGFKKVRANPDLPLLASLFCSTFARSVICIPLCPTAGQG